MSQGGLVQLVAIGAQNSAMNLRNISHDYHKFSTTNSNELVIERIADTANIEFLELSFVNQDIDNLNDIKKLILTLEIGDSTIQQLPLNLLMNLNTPIMNEGKMYINLCFDMLFGDIKLIGFQWHTVKFKLSQNEIISEYGVTSTITFLNMDERRRLYEDPHQNLIQQISFIDIKVDLNDDTQTSDIFDLIYLPFESISKGFFIQCDNVDNLNNILLKFNGMDRFNLNRFLIMTKCKKINQNMLYLPFNYEKSYSERTIQSFEGSANLSRIDNIALTLKFNVAINNVKIYCLQSNIFRQMSGMGGLTFNQHLCSNTYDLRSNPLSRQEPLSTTTIYSTTPMQPIRPPTVGTTMVYTGPTMKPIINEDASNCPILCEPIGAGGRYMCCSQCNNNFNDEALKQWLESKRPHQRTCPTCRVQWSNFEIYINGENSEARGARRNLLESIRNYLYPPTSA